MKSLNSVRNRMLSTSSCFQKNKIFKTNAVKWKSSREARWPLKTVSLFLSVLRSKPRSQTSIVIMDKGSGKLCLSSKTKFCCYELLKCFWNQCWWTFPNEYLKKSWYAFVASILSCLRWSFHCLSWRLKRNELNDNNFQNSLEASGRN